MLCSLPMISGRHGGPFPNYNKLFQMRPAEIARMEGVKNPHGVRGMIIRVSDQLRCGEISLFEKDPEEADAAKAKLDAQRKKRRERYAKNKDKVNAKRRKPNL